MDNSKWGAQRGWNRISVKREISGESSDNEHEMQEAWEPLVKQVKQEQSPMDTEIGNVHEGQFAPNTAVKYEAEESGRDSDSGIVEECPSEGTSEEVREDDDSQLEEIQSMGTAGTCSTSSTHLEQPQIPPLKKAKIILINSSANAALEVLKRTSAEDQLTSFSKYIECGLQEFHNKKVLPFCRRKSRT
ncbi:uncharacterized protein LOC126191415 [Schistocerca cancellata]|uniref:uncharacterized protein LOC126191415 n=1 Tax=Schistocerca cancellata TaxID=274614 RepID=UPI002118F665|nr:uncharacterized protein LOC126191415 [Schistocerca cancellata]XP_049788243.1 uncharacterized protein LOC126191415 [Schistocerca cancellata]XP_049788244.1 uncharacterized protein LOC126191415 [Schistocerca cancellata]